jgi:hypothetical protein
MEQAAKAHRRIEAGVDHGKVVLIHAHSKDSLSSKTP